MTSASMPSTPAAVSLQQGNQMAPTTTGGATSSAGQFEHITVMTSLQQTPEACTEMTVSSAADGGAYAVITTTSAAGLQIYPPSAITQQVQQSVPALSASLPSEGMQNRAVVTGTTQRTQPFRSSSTRAKTSTTPALSRGGATKQLASIAMTAGDDGPTVRQHLQQQHKVRLQQQQQQQLALQERMKSDKTEITGDYATNSLLPVDTSLPSCSITSVMNLTTSSASSQSMPELAASSILCSVPVSMSTSAIPFSISDLSESSPVNMATSNSIYVSASAPLDMSTSASVSMPTTASMKMPVSAPRNMSESAAMNVPQPCCSVNMSDPASATVPACTSINLPGAALPPMDAQALAPMSMPGPASMSMSAPAPMNMLSPPTSVETSASTSMSTAAAAASMPVNMVSVSVPMSMPPLASMNMPAPDLMDISVASSSMNMPISLICNNSVENSNGVPMSPSMNMCERSQVQHHYASMPQQQRVAHGQFRQMRMPDNLGNETAPSMCPPKQFSPSRSAFDDEAFQYAAPPAYQQINPQGNFPSSNVVSGFPQSPELSAAVAAAGAVDMQIENALNKSQGRKRCHGTMSAPQIRVTVLGTESEPAPQQIIAESDRALPIHEIACHSKQVGDECAKGGPRSETVKAQKPFIGSQVVHDPFVINCTPLPCSSNLCSADPVHSGNVNGMVDSSQHSVSHAPAAVSAAQELQQYTRKLYFMKRMTRSLVIKNAALCDEVSRLRQRIQTVTEERKVLAKRLQHHERNRIRRIQTKLKKEAAAQALKAAESYVSNSSSSSSLVAATAAAAAATGREGGTVRVTADVDNDESDETITSSGAATPNTSASISRVETPEPSMIRNQEMLTKQMADISSVQNSGNHKLKGGNRRQYSAKNSPAGRKDRKVFQN